MQAADTSRLQLRACGNQVHPWGAPTVLPWRCRRSHSIANTTLRCSYCVHAATPSHGTHFEHAQSERHGKETALRPMEMLLCSRRPQCAHHGAVHFSETPHGPRETQLWCERPLMFSIFISILVYAAASLICARLVSAHISVIYVIPGST